MGIKYYLSIMILATLICWSAWLVVVFNVNPYQSGFWSITFFYLSLFLSLIGSFSIVGFLVRIYLLRNKEPYFRIVKRSFRHSLFFSLLLIIALVLQGFRLLNWWNLIILILALTFFEMSFLAEKTKV